MLTTAEVLWECAPVSEPWQTLRTPRRSVRAGASAATALFWTAALAGAVQGATLSGSVHYSGILTGVSAMHPIKVLVSTDPNFAPPDPIAASTAVTINGGTYTFDGLTPGTYYLAAALALVPSEFDRVHVGEPFQIYNGRLAFPGDPITVPQSGVDVD